MSGKTDEDLEKIYMQNPLKMIRIPPPSFVGGPPPNAQSQLQILDLCCNNQCLFSSVSYLVTETPVPLGEGNVVPFASGCSDIRKVLSDRYESLAELQNDGAYYYACADDILDPNYHPTDTDAEILGDIIKKSIYVIGECSKGLRKTLNDQVIVLYKWREHYKPVVRKYYNGFIERIFQKNDLDLNRELEKLCEKNNNREQVLGAR
ncbi:hypothetical protein Aperf_G00000029116 [Anoplocephala perfoliata]